MKLFLLFCLVVEASSLIPIKLLRPAYPLIRSVRKERRIEWILFKKFHRKHYDPSENARRRRRYVQVRQWIADHNERYRDGMETYRLGINQFTDMTLKEAREFRNGLLTDSQALRSIKKVRNDLWILPFDGSVKTTDLPETLDWRKMLDDWPPIKNQRNCGSCWAYSAVGAIEYQLAKIGIKTILSEQELIDCSRTYRNKGCSGGLMTYAFNYIVSRGISSFTDYPSKFKEGECLTNSSIKFEIAGFKTMDKTTEDKLMVALATYGPLCVAVDASQSTMFAYDGGVYKDNYCSNTTLNHGLIVVGYGSEDDLNYWLLRNSWGKHWGEGGYMKILRDDNQCGILTLVSFPILKL